MKRRNVIDTTIVEMEVMRYIVVGPLSITIINFVIKHD